MEEYLKISLIILIFSSFQFDRAKPMEDEQTKEPITTTTTPQGTLTKLKCDILSFKHFIKQSVF